MRDVFSARNPNRPQRRDAHKFIGIEKNRMPTNLSCGESKIIMSMREAHKACFTQVNKLYASSFTNSIAEKMLQLLLP